ncbi:MULTISPECIES: hypothetical protein [unclassified Oceanispirochaeta]|nr:MULTISPECIES: hypothetical protein [unclassified Oceanispirochaeta]MBF9018288.1 hypothetical protein [Oceanispirochaeta sp. M2]NPD74753.1 hypothetical protein [Oceanispirochaeta sp. M1]
MTEERRIILDQLYHGMTTMEVFKNISDFVTFTDEKEDWFACQLDECFLPSPQLSDSFDGLESIIDHSYETLMIFLLNRIIADNEGFQKALIYAVFQNDYSLWKQIDSLFNEVNDAEAFINKIISSLINTISENTFIEELKKDLRHMVIDYSPNYQPPVLYEFFLDQLLIHLSVKYEPSRNILFLFFFNSLYSGPMTQYPETRWYNTEKRIKFSQLILAVLTSKDEQQIQDFFNFHNIEIEGFDNCDYLAWYEWIIEVTTEIIIINPDNIQTDISKLFIHFLGDMKSPTLKLLTNPAFMDVFDPIVENIYLTLKNELNNGYGILTSILSIVLIHKHYQPYLAYVKDNHESFQNDNAWIPLLALNPDFFSKNFILEQLIENRYFEYYSIDDSRLFTLTEAKINDFILEQILPKSLTYKVRSDRYQKISSLIYKWMDDPKMGIRRRRNALNETGLTIFTTLTSRMEEQNNSISQYLVLIEKILIPLDEISFITPDQINQLKKAALNQLTQLRKILRGFEEKTDDSAFIDACSASAYILVRVDDPSKVLCNLLTSFRFIEEPTLNSDLDVFNDKRNSDYKNIARSIHNILDKTHKDNGLKIRRDLTEFLIKKLKPLDKINPDRMINHVPDYIGDSWDGWAPNYPEPDPVWRYAYVHAINNLGIHSKGRNHYYAPQLFKIAENDPSERVQKAALDAAKELNRLRKGYTTGSHKKHLLNAWWWIRQAHLISTGGIPDHEGAMKTRNKEVRN